MAWWQARSRREQVLLGVMAALLVVIGVWGLVLRPLAAATAAAEARHTAAVRGLGEVTAMSGAIRRAERRAAPALAVPLVELVGQRASAAGLTAERLDSMGDGRVTLRIAAVRPEAFLRWIGELGTRDGVTVERLAATRNSDATIAAELTLRSGGA